MSDNVNTPKEIFDEAEAYWEGILEEDIVENNLIDAFVEQRTEYNCVSFEIKDDVFNRIAKIGRQNDLAIYVILLSAYKILLYKFTDNENGVVVAPTLKKQNSGYNKFVVERTEIKSLDTFKELLTKVKFQVTEGVKHQFYPIRKILAKKDNDFLTRLFNFAMVFTNIHNEEQLKTVLSDYQNDFILSITKEDSLFSCKFEYRKGVLESFVINELVDAYKKILNQVTQNVSIKMSDIEILSSQDKKKILEDFNKTEENSYLSETIVQTFEKKVRENPNHICLKFIQKINNKFKYQTLTYAETNEKANQIARMLKLYGVENGDKVSLVMKSSFEMYLSILGILKAGACYLPLSPDYPIDRISYSIKDSESRILLTNVDNFEFSKENVNMININQVDLDVYSNENLDLEISLDDTAYIIYTSGTTGRPKGVLIDERNIINTLEFRKRLHGLAEDDVILQLNTYVFDGFVATFFTPLLSGAEIIIIEKENITDIETLREAISKNGVTHFASIPLLYEEIIDNISAKDFQSVKSVVLAGDRVRWDVIQKSQEKYIQTRVVVEYGVSECAVLSTYLICTEDMKGMKHKVLIGKPIANNKVYVLSKEGTIQPIGIVGELGISGVGVSNKGYLNNEELTKEKFVKNTFDETGVIYKTGDLVRWTPDGLLEYIGRKDNQVKIRGFRIELGEIENQLLKCPNIKNVIVTTKKIAKNQEKGKHETYICAYYILDNEENQVTASQLKIFLKGKVPEYMIPTFFEEIDRIPLTTNNKIDFNKLPVPNLDKGEKRENPISDTEKKLALIWSEILEINVDIIWRDSNFFELGGHSLNVTKLLSRIYAVFDISLTVTEVYEKNTIEEIAQLIDSEERQSRIEIIKSDEKEYYKVSSAQKRMYFVNELDPSGIAYNIITVKKLRGLVNVKHMEETFNKLIQVNEMLRTSFHNIDGEVFQKVHSVETINFKIDIVEELIGESVEKIQNAIETTIKPFDLSKPGLFRVTLIAVSQDEYFMVLDIHHMIADGNSVKILIEEFVNAYKGNSLPRKEIQYRDFAQWQVENEHNYIKQKEYWNKRFTGEIPVLDLPIDYVRPTVKKFEGNAITFNISKENEERLKNMVEKYHVSMFTIILSVYNIFLHKLSGSRTIVVGVPTLGRKSIETERMVGMFANTLACRNDIIMENSFNQFLLYVDNNVKNDIKNEEYLYENLVNDLNIERNISRNPLFDTMLNYEDIEIPDIEMDGIAISDYKYNRKTSKFDLTLNCLVHSSSMKFEFEYDIALFEKKRIEKFILYFNKILDCICKNENILIKDILMVPKKDYDYIFQSYNATDCTYPKNKTIIDLFEEQVSRNGENVALKYKNRTLTYIQLQKKVNQLANKLTKDGYGKGDIIGIMMDRSIELVISILATMKIGAVYIPIGREYHQEKVEYVIENSKLILMLVNSKMYQDNSYLKTVMTTDKIVIVDDFIENEAKQFSDIYENQGTSSDSVYIIYTSGSTGKSKGVEVGNQSLTNYICWSSKKYVIDKAKNFPLFTSISFDLTVTSIFTPLISGTTLVIYNEDNVVSNLEAIINDKEVQIVKLTPSHLKVLAQLDCTNSVIQRLIVGGENLTTKLASQIYHKFENGIDIVNEYGPTEATVGCMIYHYNPELDNGDISVPIGVPADNVKIYVLDQNYNLLPQGMKGEMFISGDALAKGYVSDEELTHNKFLPCPYNNGLMYKTGDLVQYNQNGDLVFLDRNDRQIKINGYRIDLAEVEGMILRIQGVKDVVILVDNFGENKELLAFLVLETDIDENEIKKIIEKHLPNYMLPERISVIDNIPVTKGGKIDTKFLLENYVDRTITNFDIEESGTNEDIIRNIWSSVLGKDSLQFNENFFEVGGNSMKVLKVKLMLEEKFNITFPIAAIFEYPTIRQFSDYINKSLGNVEKINDEENVDEEELQLLKSSLNSFMEEEDE